MRCPALKLRVVDPESGARMQRGGGHTGMVIGLVTTVVYTVTGLQKNTKSK